MVTYLVDNDFHLQRLLYIVLLATLFPAARSRRRGIRVNDVLLRRFYFAYYESIIKDELELPASKQTLLEVL